VSSGKVVSWVCGGDTAKAFVLGDGGANCFKNGKEGARDRECLGGEGFHDGFKEWVVFRGQGVGVDHDTHDLNVKQDSEVDSRGRGEERGQGAASVKVLGHESVHGVEDEKHLHRGRDEGGDLGIDLALDVVLRVNFKVYGCRCGGRGLSFSEAGENFGGLFFFWFVLGVRSKRTRGRIGLGGVTDIGSDEIFNGCAFEGFGEASELRKLFGRERHCECCGVGGGSDLL